MPEKLVTHEAEEQALELLLEASSILRARGWNDQRILDSIWDRWILEDEALGAPA